MGTGSPQLRGNDGRDFFGDDVDAPRQDPSCSPDPSPETRWRLLKPAEVARRLGLALLALPGCADGRIPSLRLGGPDGPLRFLAEDVDHWLEEARARWSPGRRAEVRR